MVHFACPRSLLFHVIVRCLLFIQGVPGGLEGRVSTCNAGDPGSIPELGRSPGEGNGNPLQYSCLENPMDGGAHGVAESDTTEGLHFYFSLSIIIYFKNRKFLLCFSRIACGNMVKFFHFTYVEPKFIKAINTNKRVKVIFNASFKYFEHVSYLLSGIMLTVLLMS